MKGTVKWYNARKGYGFLTPSDNSEDVFVHATSLKECGLKKLYTGSEVTFEIVQDDKGKRAKSIKVTKEVKPTEEDIKTKKKEPKKEVKAEKKEPKKEVKAEKKEPKKEPKAEKKEPKKEPKAEKKAPKKDKEKKSKESKKK